MRAPLLLLLASAALGCATPQPDPAAPSLGTSGTMATGSAGPQGVVGRSSLLETCGEKIGAAALYEGGQTGAVARSVGGGTNPLVLTRLIMAQSECFTVVDRGQGLAAGTIERNLAAQGQLEDDSAIRRPQMVVADYNVSVVVSYSDPQAADQTGTLVAGQSIAHGLNYVPIVGPLLSIVASNVTAGAARARTGQTLRDAGVVMYVSDNRTGVQIAIAQGSATKEDLAIGGRATYYGRFVAGLGLSRSESTDQAKIVVGAMIDAFNQVVAQLRTPATDVATPPPASP